MFKSELTGKMIGPNIKPMKLVVERRLVQYNNVVRGKPIKDEDGNVKEGRYNRVPERTVTSEGWEIVRELTVSPDEYRAYNKKEGN